MLSGDFKKTPSLPYRCTQAAALSDIMMAVISGAVSIFEKIFQCAEGILRPASLASQFQLKMFLQNVSKSVRVTENWPLNLSDLLKPYFSS